MRLSGKVALITGAGSGIGREIALTLSREGAALALAGQRQERLDEVASSIRSMSGRVWALPTDVSRADSVTRWVEGALREFGRIDVLVNNAAKNRPEKPLAETVAELSHAWWAETLDVNLTGAFYCCKAVLPSMLAQGSGVILNIASTSGIAGNLNQGAYVASKHGLVGLTRSIALDYGPRGIRANVICPGFIETERSLKFSTLNRGEDWREKKLAEIPLRRFGRTSDVAQLAAFLASEESSFISGATIPIDGGTAARRG